MVSALVSRLSDPGSSSGRGHSVVFLGIRFILTVSLPTQVYKWVLANLMPGVTLRWSNIPSMGGGGGIEILLVASCDRNRR